MDRLPRPNSRIRRPSSLCSLRSYALRSLGPPPFLSTVKSPSVPPDGKGAFKVAEPSASPLQDSPDSPGSSVPSARVSRDAPLDDAASPSAQDNTPPRAAMSSLSPFKDTSMRLLTSPKSAFVPIQPAATSTPSSVLTLVRATPAKPSSINPSNTVRLNATRPPSGDPARPPPATTCPPERPTLNSPQPTQQPQRTSPLQVSGLPRNCSQRGFSQAWRAVFPGLSQVSGVVDTDRGTAVVHVTAKEMEFLRRTAAREVFGWGNDAASYANVLTRNG
ncbi:putative protein TPRXL [Ischnura elegans]|uniref:putative protein TPRXL n=1 Tax=Ischnura elegans TaxID=197161 RepID=UPI001ED8B192|nr:putative protein TPRXL [Ischnura elegans]